MEKGKLIGFSGIIFICDPTQYALFSCEIEKQTSFNFLVYLPQFFIQIKGKVRATLFSTQLCVGQSGFYGIRDASVASMMAASNEMSSAQHSLRLCSVNSP